MTRWLAALLLLACVPARAASPISFVYTEATSFLAAYVARDQGIFARHGLEVTLTASPSSGTIAAALQGGSAQLGGIQSISLFQAVDAGLDLVAVAGTEPSPTPYKQGILARRGSGIASLRDLPGHSIGIPGLGASLDILSRELLLRAGIDDKGITRVEVPLPQLADALRSGSVDAVVAVDPSYTRVLGLGVTKVADFDTLLPAGTFRSLYAARRDWTARHGAELAAFRASLAEAQAVIAEPANEAAVRESFARWTRLPAGVVAVSPLPRNLTLAVSPASIAFWAEVAAHQHLTQSAVDPARLIAP